MTRLWNYFDGEPFLDNPSLFVLNGNGIRRRTMKRRTRDSKGRFLKRRVTVRRNDPGRKRSKRRALGLRTKTYKRANPRRGGRAVSAKRSYRRNPITGSSFGLNVNELKTAGYVVLGVVGVPFIEGFIVKILPTTGSLTSLSAMASNLAALMRLVISGKWCSGKKRGS